MVRVAQTSQQKPWHQMVGAKGPTFGGKLTSCPPSWPVKLSFMWAAVIKAFFKFSVFRINL